MTSELYIVTLVFQKLKMKLTKYTRILICRARSDGLSIRQLCTSFGLERKMVLRILRRYLILPVEADSSRRLSRGRQSLKNVLRDNPHLTLQQLNLRFPKIFNDCCLERIRKLTSEFYDQFVDN